ncbi:MAG: nucleoid DNA-binding protein [Porticoccus sp.]|jgi:nucleoid DNA-binding protein
MAQKKKAPAKKAVVKAPKRPSAIAEKMTKSAMLASLSETTGLTKKEVGSVLDELEVLIERSVRKRGVGEFTVPGLLKVTTVKKPARKAKKNVPNPFKPGELMDVAAKPASIAVKIRPLKKLKEFALN